MRPKTLVPVLVLLACLVPVSDLHALANRVFVSARSGNDANSCDNILAPCQTFAGAVTKVNPGGEAIVLDSGGYGPVTITKSLTIEAPPGVTAFIHPPVGVAITIIAGALDTVVLRGLVLNGGSEAGIVANTVGTLHIENCVISGFALSGIIVNAPGSHTFIKDTICRKNESGIAFFTGRGSVDHCRLERNSFQGLFVSHADVTIRDSVAAGNGEYGFLATDSGPSGILNVHECMSANNGSAGIAATSSGIARVASSAINDNLGVGFSNSGGTLESLGNNFVRGNTGGDSAGAITVISPK